MIKTIKITDKNSVVGKCWGENTINFTDGINIIYGPNGCGKSVLLHQLGYYTFVSEKGWSRGITPRTSQFSHESSFWRLNIKEYIVIDFIHQWFGLFDKFFRKDVRV